MGGGTTRVTKIMRWWNDNFEAAMRRIRYEIDSNGESLYNYQTDEQESAMCV